MTSQEAFNELKTTYEAFSAELVKDNMYSPAMMIELCKFEVSLNAMERIINK